MLTNIPKGWLYVLEVTVYAVALLVSIGGFALAMTAVARRLLE